MNHQVPQYNQNVPMLSHTDWASMAKQWATLRANVNIPPTVNKVEHYAYQNIPPPPPPPPTLSIPKPNIIPFNNEYQPITNHDAVISFNRNTQINHNNNITTNIYEPPPHSRFEDPLSCNLNSQCETFDYNHRDRPFVNFNSANAYRPPPVANNFTQNMFNLPPPTHQDYVEPQQLKPSFVTDSTPAKLFPIINNNEYEVVKSQPLMPTPTMSLPIKPHHPIKSYTNRSHTPTTRSNKGLPKWIIDDMKKIKEKERKQPFALMEDYRDHPVNSKRDEEGDIVMEDDQMLKDSEIDGVLSGKSVITTNRIDSVTTDVDIDDVNLIDEDEGVDKLDYSSKSLVDLIEMLDENELDNLKIAIIRDSLTGVMKQVTDEMIVETVNVTFSQELESTLSSSKSRAVKNMTRDSKTVNCNSDPTVKPIDPSAIDIQNEQTCYLLGLDVYESDDETVSQEASRNTDSDLKRTDTAIEKSTSVTESGRERWSSHKKQTPGENSKMSEKSRHSSAAPVKTNTTPTTQSSTSSSKDHHTSTSSSPGSKSQRHRNRSKSRERSHRSSKTHDKHRKRSRSKDRKHKSKKHSHSNSNDYGNGNDNNHSHSNNSSTSNGYSDSGVGGRWKNDKCDSAAVPRKHTKRDRSRS